MIRALATLVVTIRVRDTDSAMITANISHDDRYIVSPLISYDNRTASRQISTHYAILTDMAG